jgi:hypothetical protein
LIGDVHPDDAHGVDLPFRLSAAEVSRPGEHTEQLRQSESVARDGRRLAQAPFAVTRGGAASAN